MSRRFPLLLCGTAAMFALSVAHAQSSTGNNSAPASDDGAKGLEEIVVNAERRQTRLTEVPFTVTALTPENLTQSGVVEMASLPELVPGLTWGGQAASIEPALRGVSTTVASPGSGSPIAIYLDGVYQPQQNSTVFDLADVSGIEVLKGPQGTLFGRNATGGAILIKTLDPTFNPKANFTAEVGAYGGGDSQTAPHTILKAFAAGPLIGDVLAGSVAANYEYTSGYVKNLVTGGSLGELNTGTIRGKLLWQASDATSVLGTAYFTRRDDQLLGQASALYGVTVAAAYPDAIIPTQPWTAAHYQPQRPVYTNSTVGASVRISHTIDGLGTLTSTTGYNHYNPSTIADPSAAYSPQCSAAIACFAYGYNPPERAYSQEVILTSDQLGIVQLVSGVYGFYDEADEHDRINGGTIFSSDTKVWTRSVAVFTEANFHVTEPLTLVTGLRYTYESKVAKGRFFAADYATFASTDYNAVSPRFSAKYKLSDSVNTYFTFSKGFKGGVVASQITSAAPAKPEQLYSYEVGLKYAQHDVSLNVAAFHYDYKNMQQEFFNGIVVAPANAATAKIDGVDLDGAIVFTRHFELKSGLEWLPRARFESFPSAVAYVLPIGPYGLTQLAPYDVSGSRLLLAPKFTGNISPQYTQDLPWGSLEASATLYASSAYRFEVTGLAHQSAYAMLNAQANLTPTGYEHLRVGIYGRNLTNRGVAASVLPSSLGDQVFWQPPREIGVSVRWSY